MTESKRYSPEVRERAVRMVFEHAAEYDSQWKAMCSIATKIGCTPETLRTWVRRTEVDTGRREGVELKQDVSDGEANTDKARVQQMVINLLSNAIKFTDSGSVTVKAEQ